MPLNLNSFDNFLVNREDSIARGRELYGNVWLFDQTQIAEFQRFISIASISFEVLVVGSTLLVYSKRGQYVTSTNV